MKTAAKDSLLKSIYDIISILCEHYKKKLTSFCVLFVFCAPILFYRFLFAFWIGIRAC
jgi:hypothetical protein